MKAVILMSLYLYECIYLSVVIRTYITDMNVISYILNYIHLVDMDAFASATVNYLFI